MQTDLFVGRKKECRTIADFIRRKKNVLIYGDEGVGKSAVINRVRKENTDLNFLLSEKSGALKETLENFIVSRTGGQVRDIHRQTVLSQKKAVYRILDAQPDCIVFDHIGMVTPKFESFIEYLLDRDITLVVASRGWQERYVGHLTEETFAFEKVRISNFDRSATDTLTSEYIKLLGLAVPSEKDFKKDVYRFSQGNPRIIRAICLLAKDSRYRRQKDIDVRLIDLDRRIGNCYGNFDFGSSWRVAIQS